MIGAMVDPETKQDLERVLIDEYGHVSGNISPVVEQLIEDYVEKKQGCSR